jgi:hypothetical protein
VSNCIFINDASKRPFPFGIILKFTRQYSASIYFGSGGTVIIKKVGLTFGNYIPIINPKVNLRDPFLNLKRNSNKSKA